MKTRAAVAYQAGKPLVIETVDLQGPKAGDSDSIFNKGPTRDE